VAPHISHVRLSRGLPRLQLKKAAARGAAPKTGFKTPGPARYDRTNAGSMPGFTSASMPVS